MPFNFLLCKRTSYGIAVFEISQAIHLSGTSQLDDKTYGQCISETQGVNLGKLLQKVKHIVDTRGVIQRKMW
jgi:hypothetical protein